LKVLAFLFVFLGILAQRRFFVSFFEKRKNKKLSKNLFMILQSFLRDIK